jgi:DNA topoisomerase-6 subunit B
VVLKMDTARNRAEVISETEHPEDDVLFPEGHGTQVTVELEGRYQKGRASVDEYLEQTAIANPHAKFTYLAPTNEDLEYPRAVNELPPEAKEIKPHPKGIELGTLIQMLERTEKNQLGAFFKEEFCRVGPRVAKEICTKADLTSRTWVKQVGHDDAERLFKAIQDVRIMAPPTDCLVPIGTKAMLAGLLKEVKAEFFAASSRPAAVYRGNPFLIEVGIAYGGQLAGDDLGRVIRFANRVPLLYQQSACCSFKAVVETGWRNYGMQQARGALPTGPLVVMIHMASTWVPFTSESKEAIADYDEIRKEMKLALQECGRKLGTYLRRRQRMRRESERRHVFARYIGEIAMACERITGSNAGEIKTALEEIAASKTAEADHQLDDEGRVIDDGGRLAGDDDVIILDEDGGGSVEEGESGLLFEQDEPARKKKVKKKVKKKKKTARKAANGRTR